MVHGQRKITKTDLGKVCRLCGVKLERGVNRHGRRGAGVSDYRCIECTKQATKAYRISLGDVYNARNRRRHNRDRRKIRKEVIDHYGGKCACCGEGYLEFLSLDHINRIMIPGQKHRAGIHFYCWLRKNDYPKGVQVLCFNCNMALGIWGYCPHTRASTTTLDTSTT